jgi:hypothetical protein
MAAEGMQFPWRGNGGTISLYLGVIWEKSAKWFRKAAEEGYSHKYSSTSETGKEAIE